VRSNGCSSRVVRPGKQTLILSQGNFSISVEVSHDRWPSVLLTFPLHVNSLIPMYSCSNNMDITLIFSPQQWMEFIEESVNNGITKVW
jgi:hypothetical protein